MTTLPFVLENISEIQKEIVFPISLNVAPFELEVATDFASSNLEVQSQTFSQVLVEKTTTTSTKFLKSVPTSQVSTTAELAAVKPNPAVKGTPRKARVRITFYSGQDDQWGSRVAWPKVKRAERGRTVAADPAIFPYGTWIYVPGFGKLRVEDTGSAVKSRKASREGHPVIDIYVGDDAEAWRLAACTPEYVEIIIL